MKGADFAPIEKKTPQGGPANLDILLIEAATPRGLAALVLH